MSPAPRETPGAHKCGTSNVAACILSSSHGEADSRFPNTSAAPNPTSLVGTEPQSLCVHSCRREQASDEDTSHRTPSCCWSWAGPAQTTPPRSPEPTTPASLSNAPAHCAMVLSHDTPPTASSEALLMSWTNFDPREQSETHKLNLYFPPVEGLQ